MPDFYTRMHAASVTDTLGAGLILLGPILQASSTLVAVKLALMIGLLLFFAAPVVAHALTMPVMTRGLAPKLAESDVSAPIPAFKPPPGPSPRRGEGSFVSRGADWDSHGNPDRHYVLLTLMMLVAGVVLAHARNLFAVIVLAGLYSFLMATVLVALDAVDVAMTEAAVGAGISLVLLLGALHLCRSAEAKRRRTSPGCCWP